MTSKSSVLYVNLIVRNVWEAVKIHVTKKLERSKMIPNSMVAQAALTASELASPKHVTQAMGDEICRQIPGELKKKGIISEMEFVFQENTFAVLELRLVHVNPLALVSAWSEAGISCFLNCIGAPNRRYFEEYYLPKVLASTIATIIPQILGRNIADKKIDAETKVIKASEQAFFFFSTLNKLRIQSDEKRSNRNPFKIRKRMSSQSSLGSGSHRRQSSKSSIGSGSHRRGNSYSSLNMKRINSQSSFGNGSQRSLNSIQSVDGVGDDKTVDTSVTRYSVRR